MPNPNAQKNPSFFLPEALQGLADMGRGAARGALSEGLGGMGDLTQAMKSIKTAGFMPAMLARGLQGPTSEELNQDLRGMTPNPLTQPDRAHTARMGQTLGTIPASIAGGVGTNAAAQKAMAKLSSMQKVESMMPKAPKPAAEVLKGPEPDFMRVYSGQRVPIEGKYDIMRADPHASMGRAFYTAELPRYANKFTGNQPGANVTPVDVDRNRMLMFDRMYETPQGQMEGLDYYDMLRRQAMAKPGVGKDMIRKEILDAGFAGTQMPNATGKAYAIYDTSAAQDMSGRGFKEGGLARMAGGGVVRMSEGGGKFGLVKAGAKQAAKTLKAIPGESFQGKSGLSALSPDEEARRLIAKMDQPSVEDALKAIEEPKPVTAAQRAAAGRAAAKQIAATPVQKLSEVLGNLNVEGKGSLGASQSDRTKVGGGNIGGGLFSAIQHADPLYAGKAWGVGNTATASKLASNFADPNKFFTTLLGSEHQLKTNPIVFEKLKRGFFQAIKEGKLGPELESKINKNLELTFGEGAQIRDPQVWKQADSFERRAALADLMLGQGRPPKEGGVALGGEKSGKGVIFKPSDILKAETEPILLHPEHGGTVPAYAIGPRLVQLTGEYSVRPDLHPGFPVLMEGKDLNVMFNPVPGETAFPTFVEELATPSAKYPKGRKPQYFEWTLGLPGKGLPSELITDKYLKHLQKEGFKKGGKVKKMQFGGLAGKLKAGATAIADNALSKSKQTITSGIDPSTDLASRLTEQGRTSILPIPNRWFLQPEKFPQMQGLVEKVLQVNNMQRSDFPSGAFVNPRTGEILDKKIMEDVGVVIDPKTNRPIMSAKREIETDLSDRKKGSFTKSNLVRRQLYKPEGDPLLDELKFIATIEQSGMGHKYGLGTEYATPVEMFNTMTGDNPTLRPKSRGDVFGIGDIVGRVTLGSGKPHDVYESLMVAPKGSDVPGVKLSKKKGGQVKGRK